MIRRAFYALASILLLAIIYHLGASRADGQGSVVLSGVNVESNGQCTAVAGRILYEIEPATGFHEAVTQPIPGTANIVASGPGCGRYTVILENGEVWCTGSISGPWEYRGNIASIPTPLSRQSIGNLKSRYRK